ncbi:MAG TPA: TetR/AcrR family transcriptional regulator C-terminal domain-containing protein [Reyranella sp.]|jgi:AcrR family transcriptional regulator|nr:TetR/AcrR family transcriptional regulator C-terminal domain-containing protein [Reyranella sp.]
MPPKPKFARAQLQAAALALVDKQGLAALSMRTLAGALGTGPMTLYNYVKDRDDLDALVVEAVLAEISRPRPHGDWQHDVRAIVEATWRTVRRHPHVIPLVLTRRTLHETTLDWAEALLDALAGSGRSGSELLIAFRTVSGFVMGLAQAQLAGPLSAGADPDIARAQALPPARYPRLIEIAKAATRLGADREFRAGLDIVMTGLADPRKRTGG